MSHRFGNRTLLPPDGEHPGAPPLPSADVPGAEHRADSDATNAVRTPPFPEEASLLPFALQVPLYGMDIRSEVDARWSDVEYRGSSHQRAADRYSMLDAGSRFLAATIASVSALAWLGDNSLVGAVLATTAALVSAFTATFNPGKRAEEHRRSAREFLRLSRQFHDLNLPLAERLWAKSDDVGAYGELTARDREAFWREYQRCDLLYLAARHAEPDLTRIRGLTPRTDWGTARLERKLYRQRRVARLHESIERETQTPSPTGAQR